MQPGARNPYYNGSGEFIGSNPMRIFSESEPKTTTRIIYNGNNCAYNNDFNQYQREQFECVNVNNSNNSFYRQMGGGSFYGDNRHNNNWNYSQSQQRLQGQTRFVKIQGPKMHPQGGFRHVMVKQQRQHPNRRLGAGGGRIYNTSNYNNRNRRMMGGNKMNSNKRDYYYTDQQSEIVNRGFESENRSSEVEAPSNDVPGNKTTEELKGDINNHSAKALESPRGSSKNVDKKSAMPSSSSSSNLIKDSLSYEDLTDNSDDNSNNDGVADLRERLLRRKHEQVAKREPGELDSEDEKMEEHSLSRIDEVSRKMKKRRRILNEDAIQKKNNKACRSRPRSIPSCHDKEVSAGGGKQHPEKNQTLQAKVIGNGALLSDPYVASGYLCANPDNRCVQLQSEKKTQLGCSRRELAEDNNCSKTFCCSEAEIAELREEKLSMKRLLRETRDKLLEAKVMGSKNVKRMEEEINQLKENFSNSTKKEEELQTTLKELQTELVSRRAELGKLTMLYEVERDEKLKHEQDLTRTYQDRLTIEIDKLRALFDIEVSKMQAFYLSSMCYEDNTVFPFLKPQKRELSSHMSLSAHQKVTQTLQKDIITSVNPQPAPTFFQSLYDGTSAGSSHSGHGHGQTSSLPLYKNNGGGSAKYPYNSDTSVQDFYTPTNVNSNGEEAGRFSPATNTTSSSSHTGSNNNRLY